MNPTVLRVPLRPPQAVAETAAAVWRPSEDAGLPGVVLAPGAGTTLTHPLLQAVCAGLAARGLPTLAFDFAYATAGRRGPDPPSRLASAFRDVCELAGKELGESRPLVLGGRSMGGRIASHLAADGQPCAGCVFLGYPLHPPGRPERLRTDHWPRLAVPVLFVTGERDAMCDLDLLARERRKLTRAASTLQVVAGADHGFSTRRRDRRAPDEVRAEIIEVVASWVRGLVRR